jgi:hypothetical protein
MVAFTEQSSWLLHVRLLSPNQGHVAFTGSRRNFQLSGQWVQLPRGAAGPTGPMPFLLGPEIGPLNLGRSEGDISSAWPFNSDGPNIYFFLSLLTPDSRSPWSVAFPANTPCALLVSCSAWPFLTLRFENMK